MYTIILALYVFVCLLLIIAVLLQNSKGSDLGSALGGGSGDNFGPKAPASIMNKITTVIAAAFLILSLVLAMMSGLGEKSVMSGSVMQSKPMQTIPADKSNQAPITGTTEPVIPANQETK